MTSWCTTVLSWASHWRADAESWQERPHARLAGQVVDDVAGEAERLFVCQERFATRAGALSHFRRAQTLPDRLWCFCLAGRRNVTRASDVLFLDVMRFHMWRWMKLSNRRPAERGIVSLKHVPRCTHMGPSRVLPAMG